MDNYDGAFAKLYDMRWSGFSRKIAPHVIRYLERELPDSGKDRQWVCDLCCGAGQFSLALGHHGFNVHAIDISQDMLRITNDRLGGLLAHGHARVDLQDAAEFTAPEPLDAVVSLFDSINHLEGEQALVSCLKHSYEALKPGGIMLFDVNTAKGLERWNNMEVDEADHWTVISRGVYEPGDSQAYMRVSGFVEVDGEWERFRKRFHNTVYRIADLTDMMRRAGFGQVKVLGIPQLEAIQGDPEQAGRVFMEGRKEA